MSHYVTLLHNFILFFTTDGGCWFIRNMAWLNNVNFKNIARLVHYDHILLRAVTKPWLYFDYHYYHQRHRHRHYQYYFVLQCFFLFWSHLPKDDKNQKDKAKLIHLCFKEGNLLWEMKNQKHHMTVSVVFSKLSIENIQPKTSWIRTKMAR